MQWHKGHDITQFRLPWCKEFNVSPTLTIKFPILADQSPLFLKKDISNFKLKFLTLAFKIHGNMDFYLLWPYLALLILSFPVQETSFNSFLKYSTSLLKRTQTIKTGKIQLRCKHYQVSLLSCASYHVTQTKKWSPHLLLCMWNYLEPNQCLINVSFPFNAKIHIHALLTIWTTIYLDLL